MGNNTCVGSTPPAQDDVVTVSAKDEKEERKQEPKPLPPEEPRVPQATLASTTTVGSDTSAGRRVDTGTQIAGSNFRYSNNNSNNTNRSNFVANVVTMKIVYLGLFSEKLIAQDGEPILPIQKNFEQSMKKEIAKYARTLDHKHVHVALYVGEPENSIVCIVTVVPPENARMTLEQVKDSLLDRRALEEDLRKHISTLQGITAVTADPIKCTVEDVFLDQWKEAATADGEVYYWSVKTRTSNWHNPMEAEEDEPEPQAPEAAPIVVAETPKLVLTFQMPQEQQEKEVTFWQRPVGLVWHEGRYPLRVQECRPHSFAAGAGIQPDWVVHKVNGQNIKEGKDYGQACQIIIDACMAIPKKGTDSLSFA